jgi:hypothetical protein
MDPDFNKDSILRLLYELDRKDPERQLFGARAHEYQLFAPLREPGIAEFEERHQLSLPEDYRFFITEVGNGGAGPYYGLFQFGEQDDGYDFCKWEQGFLVGDLSQPFPHEDDWNLPESFWRQRPDPGPEISLEEEDRLMEAWDKELEEKYWHPRIMNGAIPICHLGCALRHWLVIKGTQRGIVWCDYRVDDKGLHPFRGPDRKPMTFSDWYMYWLNSPREAIRIK